MKRYEGFFLFDNAVAHEWPAVEQEIRRLCDRVGGELQVCRKFDERKLAYEIRGRKRGTYVLTYFDAPPERIVDLERDARLSEMILRALVLRTDKVTEERIAELKASPADAPLAPGGDGRRGHDEPRARREPPAKQQETTTETVTEAEKAPSATPAEPATLEPAAPADTAPSVSEDTSRPAEPGADIPAEPGDAPSGISGDTDEEI